MATSLFINRRGVIQTTAQDANQCKAIGHGEYFYHVRIECTPKLDGNRFLVDHVVLDDAITTLGKKRSVGSCEQLGLNIINTVELVLNKAHVNWLDIHLVLKPSADAPAWMEVRRSSVRR
jgi:hypothetical protein